MHEFIAKKGLISQGNAQVTGSLVVRDGITGRLYDTASYAITTSYAASTVASAVSASFASASISASYSVQADFAQTASFAFTSSYEMEVEISSSWASASISASSAETASLALELSRSDAVDLSVPNWLNGKLTSTSDLTRDTDGNYHFNADIIPPPDALAVPEVTVNQNDPNNYNLMRGYGGLNNYLQFAIRNTSSANQASTDFIAEADDATESSSYVDLGIASSGYNYGGAPLVLPRDGYVFASNGNFLVGTYAIEKAIKFFVGTDITGSTVYIDKDGLHGTASIEGTASVSISSSNTISASYAITASSLNPGSMLYVVSGSDGIPPAYIDTYDYCPTNSLYRPPYKEGRMGYDARYIDWWYYPRTERPSNPWRFHLGKEVTIGIHNPTAVTMSRLSVVYVETSSIAGAYQPDVGLAIADGTGTKSKILGVVRDDIGPDENGFCLTWGVMHRTNMGTFQVGDKLYLSPDTPGAMTTAKPGQPNEVVLVGYCSEAGTIGSFICAPIIEPPPANAFAGMTAPVAFTDNTSSYVITISTSSVNLYSNAEGVGAITQYPVLSASFVIPNSTSASFIYAEQSGTVAVYKVTSTFDDINGTTRASVAILYRADEDMHVMTNNEEGLALANKLLIRLIETDKFAYESGFTLYATGSNQYFITAGQVWYGATQLAEDDFDSRNTGSVPKMETHFAYHSASAWTIPTVSDGSWPNGYYDNGTDLVPLSTGYYATIYFYRILGSNDWDEDVFYLLGNNEYSTLAAAQASLVPSDIPSVLADVSLLVGRFIVQSGSNTPVVESAFITNFGQASISIHNNLAGLQGGQGGEYYHMTQTDYIGTGTGLMVRATAPTMSLIRHTGATPGHMPYWSTEQTLTYTSSISVIGGEHVLINSASFPDPANPEALLIKQAHLSSSNVVGAYNDFDGFSQIYNQNYSSGSAASTDIVATSDVGNNSSSFIDVGINSSGYNNISYPFEKPLDAYVEVDGGDFWLLTDSIGKSIRFSTDSGLEAGRVWSGSFYISGTLEGTASRAITASLADKATDLIAVPLTAVSASWASRSYNADTASYIQVANVDGYPAFADSSSYAGSASIAAAISFVPDNAYTASYFITSSVTNATSASYALSASWAPAVPSVSSSYAETASYAIDAGVAHTISFVPIAAVSASWVSASAYIVNSDTASYVLNAVSASYVPNLYPQQFLASASWASASISASYAVLASDAISASYVPNLYPQVPQETVPSASWVSASAFITTAQTASFVTASNVVGVIESASFADTAVFSQIAVNAYTSSWAGNAFTASYFITSSVTNATSASYAISASYVPNLYPQEYLPSASWASASISASYVPNLYPQEYLPSASWASSSISASYSTIAEDAYFADNATSASHALFSDQAFVALGAVSADTASYLNAQIVSASWASASISASFASVAAIADAISFVPVAATSASWASSSVSASYSITTSYALGVPAIKSGIVAGTSFAGNPKTASIVFTTPFPNNNYSVTVTGEPSRTWTIQNKVSGSFQINANNNTAFTTNVFWQAIGVGEFYS